MKLLIEEMKRAVELLEDMEKKEYEDFGGKPYRKDYSANKLELKPLMRSIRKHSVQVEKSWKDRPYNG